MVKSGPKNSCKSIFGRENCNIYIGFKRNIPFRGYGKAEGS